ncbi:hypothetical protein B7494_g8371 [Chlorociboria aeruginascens]|nr:hypothetical protein B7494_g8371 [Chlorociboria aeruginascens]
MVSQDKKFVVVFGATGIQGGSVVKAILHDPIAAQQFKVRAITRDPSKPGATALVEEGAEVVKADLEDKESLRLALKNTYAVFMVTNFWEAMDHIAETRQGKNVADIVKHLIWSSLPNITQITNNKLTAVVHFDGKAHVDDYIRSLSIPYTIIHVAIYSSFILESLVRLPTIPPSYVLVFPQPASAQTSVPLIDASADVGKFVKAILLNPEKSLSRQFNVAENFYTIEEILNIFKDLGINVIFQGVDQETFKAGLASKGLPSFFQEDMTQNIQFIEEYGYFNGGQIEEGHKMEEEPTQPATQIVMDPRRLGKNNSGISDEDTADIFCILHPASPPAYRAAALIHKSNPRHTLNIGSDVKIRTRDDYEDYEPEFDLEAQGLVSCDIALRLSANSKDPNLGFVFGRNKERCDFVIGSEDEAKRVSNVHFRIYINEHGSIMLEDCSTNGTIVDGMVLSGKNKENGQDYRHTLEPATLIILKMLPPQESFKFIVRIPPRDEAAEDAYQQNLAAYFLRLNNFRDRGNKKQLPDLFPIPEKTGNSASTSAVGRFVREWRGGQKYNKVGTIGKGAFAVVYKITSKFDGIPFAAKELEKRRFMKNGILDQKVDQEMRIMSRITHPNIVQFIEHVDWEDYLYIIMEYIPGGDLGSLVNECRLLPESTVKAMAEQLLDALAYLHKMGITHRDVKPDNILILSREPFHVKLTDFGLSKMVDSEETFLRTFCGTLLYCAPEVYSEFREYDHSGNRNLRGIDKKSLPPQRYGHAVDIWSLAGVLFYSLCGSPPYVVKSGTSYQELLNQIMTKALDIRPLQRANVSDHGIRCIRSMLHVRPEHRATISELQESPWFTGIEVAMSIEDESQEVGMIDDDSVNQQLEEGASQLSIQELDGPEVNDSQGVGFDSVSDLTELQRPEIPGSFNSNGSLSETESFGLIRNATDNIGNTRLFGEVNISTLGSSGAIPFDHPNLPVPGNHRGDNSIISFASQTRNRIPATMKPPPAHNSPVKIPGTNDRATKSSGLMGAESLVGHLNIHSLSDTPSPAAEPDAITTYRDQHASLRRPREEEQDDSDWPPADLPPKKQRRSAREIDIALPKSIFWDPGDRSTHHQNYPEIMVSDLANWRSYAASKGEDFVTGGKIFEKVMKSFRSGRNPSVEPQFSIRAQSDPTVEEGRRRLMVRDDRKLGSGFPVHDNLPNAAHGSHIPTLELTKTAINNGTDHPPLVGNDFQPPKKILAKLIATNDSCLPTVNLNITRSMTSWGRGIWNTVRYSNTHADRIPLYGFMLLLFKPGYWIDQDIDSTPWEDTNSSHEDMVFYISSKGSDGVFINGVDITCHHRQKPYNASKSWAGVRNGDIITVGRDLSFKFECFWGRSKEARKHDEKTEIVEDKDFLAELELARTRQEMQILEERGRKEEEEQETLRLQKEREDRGNKRPIDSNISFAGVPRNME